MCVLICSCVLQELHATLENSNLDAKELENARAGQVARKLCHMLFHLTLHMIHQYRKQIILMVFPNVERMHYDLHSVPTLLKVIPIFSIFL